MATTDSPLDPKEYIRRGCPLKKDGIVVDGFRVVGRVVELAVKLSLRTGSGGLREHRLPQTITMTLDRRGAQSVQVHPEDRALAVKVARHVRLQLMRNGLNLSDAIVKEMDTSGEHDCIADMVKDDSECDEVGRLSIEIKCRRLWSEQGKSHVRKALRKEEVEECRWWQRALSKRGADWAGRAILLVCVDQSGHVSSKAEWKPVQAGWRVLGVGILFMSTLRA